MEQHPIPQNIASYEFRLVGDMTLKQFFQLAGGILAGLLIYQLPLIGIVRYPLVGLAVFTGVAMAFIPLNGRPFGRWILAFLRAIYSPTEFYWAIPTNTAPLATSTTTPAPVAAPIFAKPVPDSVPTTATPIAEVIPVSDPTPTSPSIPTENTPVFSAPTATKTNAPVTEAKEIFMSIGGSSTAPAAAPATSTTKLIAPERPNILTGLVLNIVGNPVETTIIEIIDNATGIPARALRTNRLGQFQIATPLPLGKYMIQAEKEGYQFEPITIEVNDTIIDPISIVAKPI